MKVAPAGRPCNAQAHLHSTSGSTVPITSPSTRLDAIAPPACSSPSHPVRALQNGGR